MIQAAAVEKALVPVTDIVTVKENNEHVTVNLDTKGTNVMKQVNLVIFISYYTIMIYY